MTGPRLSGTNDGGSNRLNVTLRGSGPMELEALAYDLTAPDPVVGAFSIYVPQCCTMASRTSRHGGQTWADMPAPDAREIDDLAVGIDGLTLYAATERGEFRSDCASTPPGWTRGVDGRHARGCSGCATPFLDQERPGGPCRQAGC